MVQVFNRFRYLTEQSISETSHVTHVKHILYDVKCSAGQYSAGKIAVNNSVQNAHCNY